MYQEMQELAHKDRTGPLHVIMLPYLLHQTDQLHFVTDMKFDMLVYFSATGRRLFLFCIVEGNWLGNKT